MKTYTINKDTHRAKPIELGLYIGGKVIEREVIFTPSCRYYLPEEDAGDINKLFGIGYLWSHHTNSARFGWNYDEETDRINLFAYCYVKGRREIVPICKVQIGEKVRLKLTALRHGEYFFEVFKEGYDYSLRVKDDNYQYAVVKKYHHNWIGFPLGIYFGGNRKAPETIKIKMKKL